MTATAPNCTFITGKTGRLFILTRGVALQPARFVLIVPPFAEELNKSRKMFTEVSRGLAARGIATVLPDLSGTGDSEGEFRDCDWNDWIADIGHALKHGESQGWTFAGLLCVRLGCILGAQTLRALSVQAVRTVLWQPVVNGERFMTQFLRLGAVATMIGGQRESTAELRVRIRSGAVVEIAGYELTPRLLAQVEAQRLASDVSGFLGQIQWCEIAGSAEAAPDREANGVIENASGIVRSISVLRLVEQPFWSATEIVTIPALISATVDALAQDP